MTSRLRRPAGAILAGTLAAGVLSIAPLAHAAVGGAISGTLTAPGADDVSGLDVAALQEVPNGDGTYWEAVAHGDVAANGEYVIRDLPAGTYRLEFGDRLNPNAYASEFYEDQATVLTAKDVVVTSGGQVGGIDAELALESTISGTVTGAAGEKLVGAGVFVYEKAAGQWGYVDETKTDAYGAYTLGHLPAGTYRVEFQYETAGGEYLGEAWNNVGWIEDGQDIVLGSDDEATGINAELVAGEHDTKYLDRITQPMLTGVAQVGSTLTATAGAYSPTPSSIRIQWLRGWEAIAGATSWSYTLTPADEGQYISFVTFASLEGYEEDSNGPEYVGPVTVAPVTAAPVVTPPAPVVTPPAATITFPRSMDVKGALKVGSTLKLKKYKATSGSGVSYTFQWYAGSKKIKKATKTKLKVTRALKGKKVSVKVTAKAGTTTKKVKVKVGKIR